LTLQSTPHLDDRVRVGLSDDGASALQSILSWWQLAGVDVTVDDTPRQWLRAASASASSPVQAPVAPSPAALPATLEALAAWLVSAETFPELGTIRLAPMGTIAGGLMLLTDMPDQEDLATGTLIAGAAGRLLDGMLGAIGRDRASAYIASLAPGRPATGKIGEKLEEELGRIARHHIALARPRAVLMIGDATIRALTGMSLAPARGKIHSVNLADGTLPAVATFHPRFLLQHPALKADAWADLRMLMEILTK
jgi:uracil-DNA glycosylase